MDKTRTFVKGYGNWALVLVIAATAAIQIGSPDVCYSGSYPNFWITAEAVMTIEFKL